MKQKASKALCPKCESANTKLDWSNVNNYRWAVVRAVLTLAAGMGLGGGFDRICKD